MSAGAAGNASGAAGAAAGGALQPTWTNVYAALFATGAAGTCGTCHGAAPSPALNGNLGGLTDKAATYAALVDKASGGAMCSGMTYVTPGKPEASLVCLKVTGMQSCGMRMPPSGMLATENVQLLAGWIKAGAKND